MDNAVKYTPAGGAVTLRAVGYELFCRVDVTDTGPGIPESEQARIFQRFYRSPSASEAEAWESACIWPARSPPVRADT